MEHAEAYPSRHYVVRLATSIGVSAAARGEFSSCISEHHRTQELTMEPTRQPDSERHVIAVLRSPGEAERVARRLVDAGVPEYKISGAEQRDEGPALLAELLVERPETSPPPQAALIAH